MTKPPTAARSTASGSPASLPLVRLRRGAHRRAQYGHPWVYSNEIDMDPKARALAPGTAVTLMAEDGHRLGTFLFNPHALITARLIDPRPDTPIDTALFAERIGRARMLRDQLFDAPYYRLIHAEADGLPGTIVDRYDGLLVVQINTAGMDARTPELIDALETVLAPQTILLRNDSAARTLEGLPEEIRIAKGTIDAPVTVIENGVTFIADPGGGQKTGWFFDQRDNRAMVARLARDKRVLDLYTYMGGFALAAAHEGARSVLAVDRSEPALTLAAEAARRNNLADRVTFRRGEVFAVAESLADAGERFDIVVADPPAFVKSKKELNQGARGYRKLARLAATLVKPGGFLFIASCSHNMPADEFGEQVRRGLFDAGRSGRILARTGAASDHPLHPALPESAYLKAELIALD
ncbi:MAG: class I SAM-dependent rRNA methyltransferase [Dongiaceae bacterium]